MIKQTFNWQPEQPLLEKLITLASQRGQSPETIISEAVKQYLLTATVKRTTNSDPLVGLFASSPDLATQSEDILQQEITQKSGWTWKERSS